LKDVPSRFHHDVEHATDVVVGHGIVEQVAHAVHEDLARLAPPKRQVDLVGMQRQREAIRVTSIAHRLETFGQPLGVAVLTAGRDLRAARYRVPRRVSPLNCAVIAHGEPA